MAKYKKYEKYKDSGIEWIGAVPETWDNSKLKYIVTTTKGFAFKSELFKEQGIPIIKTTDIKQGKIDKTITYIDEELKDNFKAVSLKENDILMSTVGSKPEVVNSAVGQIGKVQREYEGSLLNQNAVILRISNEIILNEYLFYFLSSNNYRKYLDLYAHGTANQASLSLKDILDFKMYLPNFNVQEQIANFLDKKTSEIDSLIADKERLIFILEEKRKAIITEAVTTGLNLNVKIKDSGVEWIGEIPEHWEINRLKNVSSIQVSNVDKKSVEGETTVFLCNYTDVYYNDKITKNMEFMKATAKQEQIKAFSLKKDDVIITKDSETPGDIGRASWVQEDMKEVLCGYHLAQIRPRSFMNGRFLYYLHESPKIREQYCSNANGVTRFGLSKDSIKNSLIIVPPLEEQGKIAHFLDNKISLIDSMKIDINLQIEKLKEYRQSLISEAVTGKIDVRDYCMKA
jgi:type I restriction enzyme, S subunit